jgi:purine-nucleoside phosphorylase
MSQHLGTDGRHTHGSPPAAVGAGILRRSTLRPTLGVLLGSGFDKVLSRCTVLLEIPYGALPGFPRPGVAGHAGKLVLAYLARVPVAILSGRGHYYEGYSMDALTFPIRVLAQLGVKSLLLTCAAGGISSTCKPGDYVRFTDHINLMGTNPLRGWSGPELPRFVDLTGLYDADLNKLLDKAAGRSKARLHAGVYAGVCGPSYETPAEIRAFARLGADVVGMSTIPEAIVARQCGLRVAALACVTNPAAGRSKKALSHVEVLAMGEANAPIASRLLEEFARLYAETQ